jgi:hypothetical protein
MNRLTSVSADTFLVRKRVTHIFGADRGLLAGQVVERARALGWVVAVVSGQSPALGSLEEDVRAFTVGSGDAHGMVAVAKALLDSEAVDLLVLDGVARALVVWEEFLAPLRDKLQRTCVVGLSEDDDVVFAWKFFPARRVRVEGREATFVKERLSTSQADTFRLAEDGTWRATVAYI